MKKNKTMTLDEHIEKRYGKIGTPKRDKLDLFLDTDYLNKTLLKELSKRKK